MKAFQDFASLAPSASGMISLLFGSAIKTTALLGFGLVLCFILRRRHAGTRHLLWTVALCGSLVLPLLSSTLGVWQVPVLPESATTTSFMSGSNSTSVVSEQPSPPLTRGQNNHTSSFKIAEAEARLFVSESQLSAAFVDGSGNASMPSPVSATPHIPHWTTLALAVWLTGALALLLRLLVGIIGTSLLARRATEFDKGAWQRLFSTLLIDLKLTGKVRLLRSEQTLMPIACGVWRPAVLLPANAGEWSEERRRVVLLHELAHVARRDCLTQLLTQTACALYWFNPLVWYAASQSRIERERACDGYVLSVGAKPSDYAHHLLEIARSLRSCPTFEMSAIASVAMARQSQLENRLLAILEKDGKSQTTPRAMTISVTALLCFAALTIAAVRPVARAARNTSDQTIASDAKRQAVDSPASDSAFAVDSSSRDEKAVQDAARQTSEQEQKRKDKDDEADDDPTATQSIEADIERDTAQDIERDTAEDTTDLSSPVETPFAMPMPHVNPQINIRINPNFKFKYEQENEQEDATKRKEQSREQSSDYIEELATVGFQNLSVNQLIQLKTHGVTANYVKSLRAIGLSDLSVNQLATMRIHGVTPAYIEAMRAAGFAELTPGKLSTFRIHGVTPEYIKKMREAGYPNLSANQLLTFRIHGVTPEFIAGMRATGFADLSPNQLAQLRIMGVTPGFVRAARSKLGELSIDQIIALKQTGIIKDSSDK